MRNVSDHVALERIVDGKPAESDLAGRGSDEAHDRLEDGRLAAAIDADQRADRAGTERKRRIAHGGDAIGIGHGQMADLDARAVGVVNGRGRAIRSVHLQNPWQWSRP